MPAGDAGFAASNGDAIVLVREGCGPVAVATVGDDACMTGSGVAARRAGIAIRWATVVGTIDQRGRVCAIKCGPVGSSRSALLVGSRADRLWLVA